MDTRRPFSSAICLALCSLLTCGRAAALGELHWDENTSPIWADADREDIPEPPERRPSEIYDFLDRAIFLQVKRLLLLKRYRTPPRAFNVNRFEQVPDSSWYENRHRWHPMDPETFARGPDTLSGPAPGVWTVIGAKDEGTDPGFRGFVMKDTAGHRFVIKFDPLEYPELLTANEVIATKFYHAVGYHVPENYLAFMDPDQIVVREGVSFTDHTGESVVLTPEEIRKRLRDSAPRLPDGRYRCVASRFLSGKPKGPFSFTGTNRHDPNDIYPHEHRRELRALRLLHGWLNNADARELNTLDMYVEEDDRRYLKHHLIDFGAALGSYSKFPKAPRYGAEYLVDASYTLKRIFSLGLYSPAWTKREVSPLPGVGLFTSDQSYRPFRWASNYPVPAFQNMTPADAYWMARIILSFGPEHIRAAVEAGQFSHPAATDFVTQVLLQRRKRIADDILPRVCPAESFHPALGSDGSLLLDFTDVPSLFGFEHLGPPRFHAELWSLPDQKVLARKEVEGTELTFPSFTRRGDGRYLVVLRRQVPRRGLSTRLGVYLLLRDGSVTIQALEHER